VTVCIDPPSKGSPQTDTADPGVHEGRVDPPLLPLLAGLAAGIAMLVRRRTREADDRRASTTAERRLRVDARETGTAAADGWPGHDNGPDLSQPDRGVLSLTMGA